MSCSIGFKSAAILVLFTLIAAAAAAEVNVKTGIIEANAAVKTGGEAPALEGEGLDGRRVAAAAFKGRPILVDFGSIFCSSCQETIKEMRKLQEKYRGTDLALVFVVDGETKAETLSNFFRQQKVTFTVIKDMDGSLFAKYGVRLIPFQAAIDRKGIIRSLHVGSNPDLEGVMKLKEITRK